MSAILDPRDLRTLFYIFTPPKENTTNEQEENRQNIIRFYNMVLALISAVYVVVIAHFTRRYDNKEHPNYQNCVRNNFGLPVPVTHLVYRYQPLACAAAYLCAFSLIAGLFTDDFNMKFDFPNAPPWLGIVFKVCAVCYMALCLMPVFLSNSYGGTFAWIFGALYCFINMAFNLPITIATFSGPLTKAARLFSIQLPALLGYSLLCRHFINNLGKRALNKKLEFFQPCPPNPTGYVNSLTTYVKERLQPIQFMDGMPTPKLKCHERIKAFFHQTFRPPPGFYYPKALVWCLVASVWLHYFMLNRVLTVIYLSMSNGKNYITRHYPDLNKSLVENLAASNARYAFHAFDLRNASEEERFKIEYALLYYFADLFWVGTILMSVIACLVNLMSVVRILHNYQVWSFRLYQKGFSPFPQFKTLLNPVKVTTGTILFPSYQIAMMGCGYHLQIVLYMFLFMLLSIIIGLNAFTSHAFIVHFFRTMWPTFIMMTLFAIFQAILIKFVYTRDRGRTFGFDNLRSLQEFMYFASFYNVFFGIVNGAVRILFCPISSAVSVARMDMSLFPEALHSSDKAYISFLGYLYGDVMQNHPILRTFLWLLSSERFKYGQLIHSYDLTFLSECLCFHELLKSNSERRHQSLSDPESKDDKIGMSELDKIMLKVDNQIVFRRNEVLDQQDSLDKHSYSRARKRWFLAYTLARNPQLKRYRKQACENALNGNV